MTDLVAFVEARLAEDEAWALAASAPYEYAAEGSTVPPGGVHWTWVVGGNWTPIAVDPAVDDKVGGRDNYGCDVNLVSVEQWPDKNPSYGLPPRARMMPRPVAHSMIEVDSSAAGHIVRHDPARVLREVEAKRRQLAALAERPHFLDIREWYGCRAVAEDDVPTGQPCTCGRDDLVHAWLRTLAEPYSDHPDYRSEWSPS